MRVPFTPLSEGDIVAVNCDVALDDNGIWFKFELNEISSRSDRDER